MPEHASNKASTFQATFILLASESEMKSCPAIFDRRHFQNLWPKSAPRTITVKRRDVRAASPL
jgi:hypothetical protein